MNIDTDSRRIRIKKLLDLYCKYLMNLSNKDLDFLIEHKSWTIYEATMKSKLNIVNIVNG